MPSIITLGLCAFIASVALADDGVPSPLKTQLTEVAAQNKSALLTYARGGCAGLTGLPKGLDVLEMEFRGGQTARLIPVDVQTRGELVEVSFYTPGSAVLTKRTIKVRPGSDPVFITADNVKFPISEKMKLIPTERLQLSEARPKNEGASCYLARLAQDYVRPRAMAEADVGVNAGR